MSLISEDQEAIETAKEMLAITKEQFEEKAMAYCKVRQNMKCEISSLGDEIKRLQNLKKIKTNQLDILTDRLSSSMTELEIDKKDLGLFKLSFRKSKSVLIEDNELVPAEFLKPGLPDKTAIKKMLNDNSVEWASIQENNNLVIK